MKQPLAVIGSSDTTTPLPSRPTERREGQMSSSPLVTSQNDHVEPHYGLEDAPDTANSPLLPENPLNRSATHRADRAANAEGRHPEGEEGFDGGINDMRGRSPGKRHPRRRGLLNRACDNLMLNTSDLSFCLSRPCHVFFCVSLISRPKPMTIYSAGGRLEAQGVVPTSTTTRGLALCYA